MKYLFQAAFKDESRNFTQNDGQKMKPKTQQGERNRWALLPSFLLYGWKIDFHLGRTIHHQHKLTQELLLLPGSAWERVELQVSSHHREKKQPTKSDRSSQNRIPPVKQPPLWRSHTELLPKTNKNQSKTQKKPRLNKMPERMWVADPRGPFQLN